MLRSITAAAVTVAAVLTLAACGSSDPSGSSAAVAPETAKARIERAAGLELTAVKVPADAREQGMRAGYTNASTAVHDQQIVGVFVMKNSRVADKVSDMVRGTAPKSARLLVHDEVMVVYAAAGTDRGAAVARAVKAL